MLSNVNYFLSRKIILEVNCKKFCGLILCIKILYDNCC